MIEKLLEQLTLEEKISMIHGSALFHTAPVERLSIPAIYFSDGPMGVRFEHADDEWRPLGHSSDEVSYMPSNSAVASTWNPDIAYEVGNVLGEETRGRGKDVILAPGINIKRSPLCGRNFEYMSEDPRLIEKMVVPMIKGIQQHDVAACPKHFAANSQETERLWVDTIVDERTLQEIYYPGFFAALDEGKSHSVMGAYNLLNGEHCCTSKKLLNELVRNKWNYDGVIVSDWGAVHDTKLAAESALDVEMDVTYAFDKHFMADALLEKVKSGEISEELVDEKVRNLLRMMLRLKMIGPQKEERVAGAYNTRAHQEALLRVAEESLILLKNDGGLLPLSRSCGKNLAIIGAHADMKHSKGGGSAEIKALYEITPLAGIRRFLGGNGKVDYVPGYYIPKKGGRVETSWQAESTKRQDVQKQQAQEAEMQEISRQYLEEAVACAKEHDTVIFLAGLNHDYDVEGLDREDMKLPYDQDKVLEAVLDANPNTIVVVFAGSPVEMPWLSRAKAVIWAYYIGMEGGTALANVVFGEVNPSGKLAETLIKDDSQCPAIKGKTFGCKDRVVYEEGVFVGYREYDTKNTDVNFCFGHGLSYTEFAYSDLQIEGNNVSFTLKNVGTCAGKEVAQLYVAPLSTGKFDRPSHELKNFAKVSLASGEEKRITLSLTERDFSCYDVEKGAFVMQPGEYEIQVGTSSREISLRGKIVK